MIQCQKLFFLVLFTVVFILIAMTSHDIIPKPANCGKHVNVMLLQLLKNDLQKDEPMQLSYDGQYKIFPEFFLSTAKAGANEELTYISNLTALVPPKQDNVWKSLLNYFLFNSMTSVDEDRCALERYLFQLSKVDLLDRWRGRESRELSDIVQARIRYVQNPANCATARKLVCNVAECGFGCQVHHIHRCFLMAHGTNRTVIVSGVRWINEFLPMSETCTDSGSIQSLNHTVFAELLQVISLDTVGYNYIQTFPNSSFIPPYVPEDIAPRLTRFHGNPFAWWTGQFLKYILRPKPSLAADIEKAKVEVGFENPIVGLHVRRTEQMTGTLFYPLSEYMSHVDKFYECLEKERPSLQTRNNYTAPRRRVYLETDEPKVLNEPLSKDKQYTVISKSNITRNWNDSSLRSIIIDIHLLAMSDYLVCTYTSDVCRLVFGMMQSIHLDASKRAFSLDAQYFIFGERTRVDQVAKISHKAVSADEIDLLVGDVIVLQGTLFVTNSKCNVMSMGRNTRTNKIGKYPAYKTQSQVLLAEYPTYPEAVRKPL